MIVPTCANDVCDIFDQTPLVSDFTSKLTSATETAYGVAITAASHPSLQLQFSRKMATAVERSALAKTIDIDRIQTVKDASTGGHLWIYPFYPESGYSTLKLAEHRSRTKYTRLDPLTAVHTVLEAKFGISPRARPRKLIKTSSPRAKVLELSLSCRHIKMRFSLAVRRREFFIHLQGDEAVGSTVRLKHKFPQGSSIEKGQKSSNVNFLAGASVHFFAS
jgi:hypothetical protein